MDLINIIIDNLLIGLVKASIIISNNIIGLVETYGIEYYTNNWLGILIICFIGSTLAFVYDIKWGYSSRR